MVSSSRKWEGFRCRNPENDPVGSNPRSMCSNQLDATLRYVQRKKKSFFFVFFVSFLCLSSLPRPDRARDDPRAIRERGAKKIREARFLRFNLDARDASHRIRGRVSLRRIASRCCAVLARGVTRRRVRRASPSEDLRVPSTIDSISGDEPAPRRPRKRERFRFRSTRVTFRRSSTTTSDEERRRRRRRKETYL